MSSSVISAPTNASQTTNTSFQETNNSNTTSNTLNPSTGNKDQASSPPAFPLFDQIFKFFGAK